MEGPSDEEFSLGTSDELDSFGSALSTHSPSPSATAGPPALVEASRDDGDEDEEEVQMSFDTAEFTSALTLEGMSDGAAAGDDSVSGSFYTAGTAATAPSDEGSVFLSKDRIAGDVDNVFVGVDFSAITMPQLEGKLAPMSNSNAGNVFSPEGHESFDLPEIERNPTPVTPKQSNRSSKLLTLSASVLPTTDLDDDVDVTADESHTANSAQSLRQKVIEELAFPSDENVGGKFDLSSLTGALFKDEEPSRNVLGKENDRSDEEELPLSSIAKSSSDCLGTDSETTDPLKGMHKDAVPKNVDDFSALSVHAVPSVGKLEKQKSVAFDLGDRDTLSATAQQSAPSPSAKILSDVEPDNIDRGTTEGQEEIALSIATGGVLEAPITNFASVEELAEKLQASASGNSDHDPSEALDSLLSLPRQQVSGSKEDVPRTTDALPSSSSPTDSVNDQSVTHDEGDGETSSERKRADASICDFDLALAKAENDFFELLGRESTAHSAEQLGDSTAGDQVSELETQSERSAQISEVESQSDHGVKISGAVPVETLSDHCDLPASDETPGKGREASGGSSAVALPTTRAADSPCRAGLEENEVDDALDSAVAKLESLLSASINSLDGNDSSVMRRTHKPPALAHPTNDSDISNLSFRAVLENEIHFDDVTTTLETFLSRAADDIDANETADEANLMIHNDVSETSSGSAVSVRAMLEKELRELALSPDQDHPLKACDVHIPNLAVSQGDSAPVADLQKDLTTPAEASTDTKDPGKGATASQLAVASSDDGSGTFLSAELSTPMSSALIAESSSDITGPVFRSPLTESTPELLRQSAQLLAKFGAGERQAEGEIYPIPEEGTGEVPAKVEPLGTATGSQKEDEVSAVAEERKIEDDQSPLFAETAREPQVHGGSSLASTVSAELGIVEKDALDKSPEAAEEPKDKEGLFELLTGKSGETQIVEMATTVSAKKRIVEKDSRDEVAEEPKDKEGPLEVSTRKSGETQMKEIATTETQTKEISLKVTYGAPVENSLSTIFGETRNKEDVGVISPEAAEEQQFKEDPSDLSTMVISDEKQVTEGEDYSTSTSKALGATLVREDEAISFVVSAHAHGQGDPPSNTSAAIETKSSIEAQDANVHSGRSKEASGESHLKGVPPDMASATDAEALIKHKKTGPHGISLEPHVEDGAPMLLSEAPDGQQLMKGSPTEIAAVKLATKGVPSVDTLSGKESSAALFVATENPSVKHGVHASPQSKVAKPPLFPRKSPSPRDLYENPDKFVEFLSNKLVNSKLKAPFHPGKSVFANMSDVLEFSEISPPGSPPEPVFDMFHDDDATTSEGSQETPYRSIPIFVHPEIASWDMIAEATSGLPVTQESIRHPDYVMMPWNPRTPTFGDWGNSSDPTLESDLGASSRQAQGRPTQARRVPSLRGSRKRPLSSRAAAKRTRVKRSRFWRRRSQTPVLKLSKSEDLTNLYSYCPEGDDPETVSLGAQTFQGSTPLHQTVFRQSTVEQTRQSLIIQKSLSSPDLSREEDSTIPVSLENLQVTPKKDLCRGPQTEMADRPSVERRSWESLAQQLPLPSLSSEKPDINLLLGNLDHDGSTPTDHDDSMLEEELMAFSSVEPISFPLHLQSNDAVRYFGSLRWRQLISCWQHEEVVKSLMKEQLDHSVPPAADEEASAFSSPDHIANECIDVLVLNGDKFSDQAKLRRDSGLFDDALGLLSISRFLPHGIAGDADDAPLEHILPNGSEPSSQELRKVADSNVGIFVSMLKTIVGFACDNAGSGDVGSIIYNFSLKEVASIDKKAKRKYGGDVLRVTDVLRGSIIFPCLGSLVCGLIRLAQITDSPTGWEFEGRRIKLELVRVKNLFASLSPVGGLERSPLPTGYRHVLAVVRLDGASLVEIQCHLSAMYNVLGKDGYTLHNELNDLDHALQGHLQIHELIECALNNVQPSQEAIFKIVDPPSEDQTGQTCPSTDPTCPEVQEAASSPGDERIACDRSLLEQETPKRAGAAILAQASFGVATTGKPVPLAVSSPATGGRLGDEDRLKLLRDLQSSGDSFSSKTAILSILEIGASAAAANPRNVATFFCLHSLFQHFLTNEPVTLLKSLGVNGATELIEYSRRCLIRCFTLSCQARSIGMAGWLEYGENDPVVRLGEGPANLLTLIAGSYAQESKWNQAQAVLETLLLKYERELHAHHPVVIAALLKLAAVTAANGNTLFMSTLIARATERVSEYLVEVETSFMSYVNGCCLQETGSNPVFRVEKGPDALAALRWFVSTFQDRIGGESPLYFGCPYPINSVEHCLLADSIAVLANCMTSARVCCGSESSDYTVSSEQYYWKLALAHYHKAFKGLSETSGFADARVCGAAFGMARCLRELGMPETALEILSSIASALDASPASSSLNPHTPPPRVKLHSIEKKTKRSPFLSPFLKLQAKLQDVEDPQVHQHVTLALCLWFMAVLSIDGSPDERGRTRAFGLLHAASVSLQLALSELPEGDGVPHAACVDILEKIENEATKISKQHIN